MSDGWLNDVSPSELNLAKGALARLAACVESMTPEETTALAKVTEHLALAESDVEGFGAFRRPRLASLDVQIKTLVSQIQQVQSAETAWQGKAGREDSIAASLNRTAQSMGDMHSAFGWP